MTDRYAIIGGKPVRVSEHEEYAVAMRLLNECGVPSYNENGIIFSLWGRIVAYGKKLESAARAEEREQCAKIADGWDISKGGYTELAHTIRQGGAQ